MLCNDRQQIIHRGLHRLGRGVHLRQGLLILRGARLQKVFKLIHRRRIAVHRAQIALGTDPRHMLGRTGLDPNGVKPLQHLAERGRGRDNAAGNCKDQLVICLQDPVHRFGFQRAIAVRPVKRHDLVQRHLHRALDFRVQFDKWHLQLFGRRGAKGRFTRTAQANEANALRPLGHGVFRCQQRPYPALHLRGGRTVKGRHARHIIFHRPHIAQQLFDPDIQGRSHTAQQQDRDIAFPRLKLRQIARRHARAFRQKPAGQALCSARGTHTGGKPLDQRQGSIWYGFG
mmetsp:Transcript_29107/g.56037  ORF Transcript_29107/g.56037 Transcript_29107/m.56037 type:complete len:286 (+) Transcript_29107:4677-5534(+)